MNVKLKLMGKSHLINSHRKSNIKKKKKSNREGKQTQKGDT